MQRFSQHPYLGAIVFSFLAAANVFAADPSLGRWTCEAGGPSHSGFYAATIGDGSITPEWSHSYGRQINRVAVSDGRVFVTATNAPVRPDTGLSFLSALDARSGQELWRNTLPAPAAAPLVNGENVFVYAEPPWALYAFGSSDGSQKWVQPFRVAALASAGDHIWLGRGAGIVWQRISDRVLLHIDTAPPESLISVSFYEGTLYTSDGHAMNAVDPETAVKKWSVPDAFGTASPVEGIPGWAGGLMAIADGKAASITEAHNLTTVDLATKSVAWTQSSTGFTGRPATDGAAIYAVDGTVLKAFTAATGALKGTYEPTGRAADETLYSEPLVTNDAVLIASDRATYIFDKLSFKLRAKLPAGGYLSYAAGTLYVVDPSGNLLTYNFGSAIPEPAPAPWPSPTPALPPPKTDVELVSHNEAGTSTGKGSSGPSDLSPDGRYLLFVSQAPDVSSLPGAGAGGLFLRDRQTGATTLITAPASAVYEAKLSADARFVAFANGGGAYVRDLQTGITTKAGQGQHLYFSRDSRHLLFSNGTVYVRDLPTGGLVAVAGGDGNGISADGRYVLYSATSTQRAGDGSAAIQCFVGDLVTQTTTLVTVDKSGSGMGDGHSSTPFISDDGRFVVFASQAKNLVSPPPFSTYGSAVYRRDMVLGVTKCLTNGMDKAYVADISNDGEVVAVMGDLLFSAPTYIADLRTGTLRKLPFWSPLKMDGFGRRVVFASYSFAQPGDVNNTTDILLYDAYLGSTTTISHNLAGTTSLTGMAVSPIISDDGQAVAFSSSGTDLVATPKYTYNFAQTYFDAYVSSVPRSAKLLNISTRGEVKPGDGALIGGFVLTGSAPTNVLVRAIGASLEKSGVAGALQNPFLELHDSTGALIAQNDDWTEDEVAIRATGIPPPTLLSQQSCAD